MDNELSTMGSDEDEPSNKKRCPTCDAVVPSDGTVCIMCGTELPQTAVSLKPQTAIIATVEETAVSSEIAPPSTSALAKPEPIPTTHSKQNRGSKAFFVITAVFILIILTIGSLILRFQGDNVFIVYAPTLTAVSPTQTQTATPTPLPSPTSEPTLTPTITLTPEPTATLQPPRLHVVASGETLIGLSLLYRVSIESIAVGNDFATDTQVQVSQNLQIPWPTPTPPLEMILVDVNGEAVLIDPTGCDRYEVQSGDSLVGIASIFGVDFDYLAQVNRISDPSLLQPEDTICIPEIVYGADGLLPATPGPSPTPSPTSPPAGPRLLYPIPDTTIESLDALVTLQWVAVQELAEDESYMVEVSDMDMRDSLPFRGFTRDTALQLPSKWRPILPETHQMRWRVSIVKITGARSDGVPTYTFGGENSEDAFFFWLGAVPTLTPTFSPTPPPTATATPAVDQ